MTGGVQRLFPALFAGVAGGVFPDGAQNFLLPQAFGDVLDEAVDKQLAGDRVRLFAEGHHPGEGAPIPPSVAVLEGLPDADALPEGLERARPVGRIFVDRLGNGGAVDGCDGVRRRVETQHGRQRGIDEEELTCRSGLEHPDGDIFEDALHLPGVLLRLPLD